MLESASGAPRSLYWVSVMKVRTDEATHRYSLRGLPGHVPLHCLWAYGKGRVQLSTEEHSHVEACSECSRALQVCSHAQNFGAALVELRCVPDEAPDPGGKPKLKTIYVFPDPFR